MHRLVLLALDLSLVVLATMLSLFFRENLDVSAIQLFDFIPYFTATIVSGALVLLGFGLNRRIWRFSATADYVLIFTASLAIVMGAVSATFAYNRLDGVARSLPFLQLVMCQAFLIGARVLHKISHESRQKRRASASFLQLADKKPHSTVLIVGISKLMEAYLQAIAETARGGVRVAGLVSKTGRHVGRFVATYPVLGVLEDLESILDNLEVHGVTVDRIIIASPFPALVTDEREVLLRIERSRGIFLQFLAEDLGLNGDKQAAGVGHGRELPADLSFEIDPAELKIISRRPYWMLKRAIDWLGAATLLIICLPLMAMAAGLVMVSVGSPLLFWQQRPGLSGRPFRVYKFRTMRSAYASDGRKLADSERVSQAGMLLRRLRVDELPQLFNILRGDMSFIGPRPLLPCDQRNEYRARLLVRPGLSGWAQVVGGRDISPEDKAALDVWYVRNASLALDFEIVARTIPMVFFGERISRPLIERAWRDLSEGGILKGDLSHRIRHDMRHIALDDAVEVCS